MAYENSRTTLLETHKALVEQAANADNSASYHERGLWEERHKAKQLRERAEQVKAAADTLAALDAAGIVMQPKSES